jgi:hypothetical protein
MKTKKKQKKVNSPLEKKAKLPFATINGKEPERTNGKESTCSKH